VLDTATYTLEELLVERRESAVRALVRAVGYATQRGRKAEDVGRFLYDSYRESPEYQRRQQRWSGAAAGFAALHLELRWGWCDRVSVRSEDRGLVVESDSILKGQGPVLGFHGVARSDIEVCLEAFWRLLGRDLGLEVTYTIGEERDWAVIRPAGTGLFDPAEVAAPAFNREALAAHRRMQVATWITASVGFAKYCGDEPEELGQFFFRVWDGSGHYERLQARWGYGNALAYAQSIARGRQVLYRETELAEDLDGYLITSPSWATEIPQTLSAFCVLPDDIHRFYAGGGVPACARLGLQYADRSNDRLHRIWIRAR
jgi:hypothetical protein